jgi:hypothetical protein
VKDADRQFSVFGFQFSVFSIHPSELNTKN